MKVQDSESTDRRIATAPEHYRGMVVGEARFAVIEATPDARHEDKGVKQILRYLPDNYGLMESFPGTRFGREKLIVIIGGTDVAGWTLEDYVIPRLQSGLYGVQEIGG